MVRSSLRKNSPERRGRMCVRAVWSVIKECKRFRSRVCRSPFSPLLCLPKGREKRHPPTQYCPRSFLLSSFILAYAMNATVYWLEWNGMEWHSQTTAWNKTKPSAGQDLSLYQSRWLGIEGKGKGRVGEVILSRSKLGHPLVIFGNVGCSNRALDLLTRFNKIFHSDWYLHILFLQVPDLLLCQALDSPPHDHHGGISADACYVSATETICSIRKLFKVDVWGYGNPTQIDFKELHSGLPVR
mmetsp:Transcript_8571/g.14014  ORF Transcript_8571/g.14014 Transcript_8571/m.14014 type:complete len:242 (+) Transcript_8571:5150-5875(+)